MPASRSTSSDASTMVVIPFLSEDPRLVVRTLQLAASHQRVAEVIGIHGDDDATVKAVRSLSTSHRLVPQDRIGDLRPGKGDAINTGLAHFLASRCDRLHFYDADIKTFDASWIEQAEAALDLGFDTVRHFYPRAATDGMVTAMLVRPAFAMRWPHSVLARIKQPLSGEVAFTRRAATALSENELVRRQSDWGIDTIITGVTARLGLSIYESYISAGKDHHLYGSLEGLNTMLWECLGALRLLFAGPAPVAIPHHRDTETAPPSSMLDLIAFDYGATAAILRQPLSARQLELLMAQFGTDFVAAIVDQRFGRFDTSAWLDILKVLITRADLSDSDWQTIGFRLWVARVLHYASNIANKGFSYAVEHIEAMIREAMLHPLN